MWSFAVFVRTVEFGRTQFWMAAVAERIGWICNRLCTTIVSILKLKLFVYFFIYFFGNPKTFFSAHKKS